MVCWASDSSPPTVYLRLGKTPCQHGHPEMKPEPPHPPLVCGHGHGKPWSAGFWLQRQRIFAMLAVVVASNPQEPAEILGAHFIPAT